MGFEYKIRFALSPDFSPLRLAECLPDSADGAHALYDYKVEADGIYFVDFGKSQLASVAFRRIVDEALRHSAAVTIEEL
jgi:hypothetical protein